MKCPRCGKKISEAELKALWGAYCRSRRRGPVASELTAEAAPEPEQKRAPETRDALIAWLTEWRARYDVKNAGRPLGNRSLSQLKKMYEQAQLGVTYRVGRSWHQQTQV